MFSALYLVSHPLFRSAFFLGNLILRYLFKFIYTLSAIWSSATSAHERTTTTMTTTSNLRDIRASSCRMAHGFTSFHDASAYIASPCPCPCPCPSALWPPPSAANSPFALVSQRSWRWRWLCANDSNMATIFISHQPTRPGQPTSSPLSPPELSLRLFVTVIIIMLGWWRWQSWRWRCRWRWDGPLRSFLGWKAAWLYGAYKGYNKE